jgi:acyl dehydratase
MIQQHEARDADKTIHASDTLYPQLEIIDLAPHGDAGQVTARATIHNQHGQLVLDGETPTC